MADTAWPDSVDLTGYYYLMQPIPAWATDIDFLTLSTLALEPQANGSGKTNASLGKLGQRDSQLLHDSTNIRVRPVPLWGDVRLKAGPGIAPVVVSLISVHATGRELSFTTAAVGGVAYDFRGAFIRRPGYEKYGEPVLVGHLRKLVRGAVAGEAEVSFQYSEGD